MRAHFCLLLCVDCTLACLYLKDIYKILIIIFNLKNKIGDVGFVDSN